MKLSKKQKISIVCWILLAILAVILVCVVKTQNKKNTESSIIYDGKAYQKKENLTTILVLGIDQRGSIESGTGRAGSNGQSDMMWVVVIDKDTDEVQVITIPRETAVDVDEYYVNGKFYRTVNEQICLQYAYGRNSQEGCELAKEKVEELLGIPMDYYCAFSMEAIPTIVDAVGGVTVTMTEDYEIPEHTYSAGETVTLTGEEAYEFVHFRDIERYGTNLERMARQKEFLKALVPTVKSKLKNNWLLPFQMYRDLEDCMTTDIPTRKLPSFAWTALKSDFDTENIIRIPGEDIHVDKYDQYIVEEKELKKMMVDIFYEVIKY